MCFEQFGRKYGAKFPVVQMCHYTYLTTRLVKNHAKVWNEKSNSTYLMNFHMPTPYDEQTVKKTTVRV